MTTKNVPLGPGTTTVGEIGTEVDISCLINNAKITWEKTQDDPKTKLCGDVSASPPVYTFNLEGNVDQDLAVSNGLHALSHAKPLGQEHPFTFTPNTTVGATATGILVIDPLDFGGAEMGKDMTSDFSWRIVGEPDVVYGTGAAALAVDELVDDDLVDV